MAETEDSLHFLDYWRVVRSRKEIVIAVSLLVVLTGIVITYAMPRVYMASTIIAVREETPDVEVFSRDRMRFDPFFLRTQFEIIQSRPVIEEVMRQLRLDEKLGKAYGYIDRPNCFDTTVKLLRKSMKVHQYRDTNLIEIQMYMSEPRENVVQEVAAVANMVATVFRNQRAGSSREEKERALKVLNESFEEQRKRVADQEAVVDEIRRKYQIDVVSSSGGTMSALNKMSLTQLEVNRLKASMDVAEKKARLDNIEGLSPADLLDAAPYMVNDPGLVSLIGDKRKAEVEMSRLQQAYGPRHPEVVRVEASITQLEAKIGDALNGLRKGVKADYDAAAAKQNILNKELEAMKQNERDAEGEGYREFNQAVKELEHLQKISEVLETRYLQEKIEMRIPKTVVEVVSRAQPPDWEDPERPNFALNIILSILLGLGAGIGLAYFVEYLDTSMKTIDEVERYLGASVIGVIPQKVKAFIDPDSASQHAEAYRVLRTNLHTAGRGNLRTISCTSGSVGEGKSLTVFNLAYVYAKMGSKVVVVDSDLHRPTQHKIMKMQNTAGIVHVLVGDKTLDEVMLDTGVPNFTVIPSGRLSTGPHGLLDSVKMRETVEELKRRFDYVFFDSPPIIGVSDATILARQVDGVLLVVQHRKYPRAISVRAKKMLLNVGANVLGVVLNNINISKDYSYYYYHQRYGYTQQKTTQG